MAKEVPLYDEIIFLDVLPELHLDFIERIKEQRKKTKSNDHITHYHLLRHIYSNMYPDNNSWTPARL